MNKSLASLAAAAIISLGSTVAFAQDTIVLSPEAETSLQSHITTANVTPVMLDTELAVGAMVPENVTLNPVPPELIQSAPELEGHEFFVANDRIHVVDAKTRAIVTIVD